MKIGGNVVGGQTCRGTDLSDATGGRRQATSKFGLSYV